MKLSQKLLLIKDQNLIFGKFWIIYVLGADYLSWLELPIGCLLVKIRIGFCDGNDDYKRKPQLLNLFCSMKLLHGPFEKIRKLVGLQRELSNLKEDSEKKQGKTWEGLKD